MNIGIYKPGKKIYFYNNDDDHAAISVEITRIAKIIASHSHKVFIMSDTDYINDDIPNIYNSSVDTLDKIFVYNGIGLTLEIINSLYLKSKVVNLILTDMSLLPQKEITDRFKHIYTQSTIIGEYGAIEQHECYDLKFENYDKTIELYFGGTERGRKDDFFEYVINTGAIWYGKSQTLGIIKYIPYHQHIENMKKAKYSIVIGDQTYNIAGFVTPRYYECIRYNVIAFVDYKYDPHCMLINKRDYRRVNDASEMINKIKELNNNQTLYNQILTQQQNEITEKMKQGMHILTKLKLQ